MDNGRVYSRSEEAADSSDKGPTSCSRSTAQRPYSRREHQGRVTGIRPNWSLIFHFSSWKHNLNKTQQIVKRHFACTNFTTFSHYHPIIRNKDGTWNQGVSHIFDLPVSGLLDKVEIVSILSPLLLHHQCCNIDHILPDLSISHTLSSVRRSETVRQIERVSHPWFDPHPVSAVSGMAASSVSSIPPSIITDHL